MTLTSECSINRYYDPTTDQFLSVDPAVATTDQPYVFTNDNPLNSEDPLGLAGVPVFIQKQICGKKGCTGGDLASVIASAVKGIAKAVAKGYKAANDFANHVVIGFGICIGVCVNISLQGTDATGSIGGFGGEEKGPYVGYSHQYQGSARQQTQVFISGGFGFGGGVEYGVNANGTIDKSDREVDLGQVTGSAGGVTWSKSIQWLP